MVGCLYAGPISNRNQKEVASSQSESKSIHLASYILLLFSGINEDEFDILSII